MKKLKQIAMAALTASALAGCASQPSLHAARAAQSPCTVCSNDEGTGSAIVGWTINLPRDTP